MPPNASQAGERPLPALGMKAKCSKSTLAAHHGQQAAPRNSYSARAPCRQLWWCNCRSLLTGRPAGRPASRPAGRMGDARLTSDFAVCGVGGGERDGGADAGAASGCRFDGDASFDGGYAIPDVGEPDAGRHAVDVESGAVVAHVETDAVVALGKGDADRGGSAGVLRGVLHRLEAAEIHGVLYVRGVAPL